MPHALRYIRVSTEKQRDNSSLETQTDRIDAYCTANGYTSREEDLFTEVLTGIETWTQRPALQQLFKRVEELAQTDDIVVVSDISDRLARGFDLMNVVGLIASFGAQVEFCQEKFEDTEEGKLMLHMHSWSSKQEWLRIRKRTTDGRLDRVMKEHRPLGSMPLYGYKWDDPKEKNCYVYNDDTIHTDRNGTQWSERKVVEYIFQKAKEGMPLARIAQSLNDLGVPTRQRFGNNQWHTARMSEILANPKYMGKYYAFQQQFNRIGNKYHRTRKPLEERVLMPDGVCPAIVSEELWQLVQVQLDYNKRNSIRNAKFPELALCRNKVARCAYCGGAMGFKSNEGRVRYFCQKAEAKKGCTERNYIITSVVDDAVWRRCCQVINNPSEMRLAIEAMRSPNPVEKQEKPIAQRKLKIEKEIEEYVDLLHDAKTETTKRKTRAWISQLEEDLEEILQQEKILAGIKKNWQQAEEEIQKFEQFCLSMRENLEGATYSQKRTIVEFLGARVKIFKYGTKPRLQTTFAPPNIMEALAGMGKKGNLTLDALDCTDHAQRTG